MTKFSTLLIYSLSLVLNISQNESTYSSKFNEDLQHEFIDPCSLKKCSTNEICVSIDDSNANCIKHEELEFQNLSKRQLPTFCGTEECRFGDCEVFNSTSFVCHCLTGVTGENCNKLDTSGLPCSSNPCFGDSTCVNLPKKYVCVCGPGRTGQDCRDHVSPCQCQNGAVCLSNTDGTFRCKCRTGFGGNLCQYSVTPFLSCQITGCLNDGICTIFSKCHCPPGFTGLRCESLVTTTKSTTTTTVIPPYMRINLCYVGICKNGGSCYQLDVNLGICICKAGFTGPDCSSSSEKLSTQTIVQKLALTRPSLIKSELNEQFCPLDVPNPCQNNGSCLFKEITNTIFCKCPPSYKGPFCNLRSEFCLNSPCQNGGTCTQVDEYDGVCTCPPRYTGKTCEVSMTCDTNPCKNNQPCLVVNGVARCFCGSKYKLPYCD